MDASGRTPGPPRVDPEEPIRGEIRSAGYRRVSHGLYLPLSTTHDVEAEFLRELRAWRLVLPERAVFTHVTAARLRGWQLPALPEKVPVFASVQGDAARPRRPGLICSRLVRKDAPEMRLGLPVDSSAEILLRAARDLGLLDLAIMLDSARRSGDLDGAEMDRLLSSRRPGVRRLGQAYALSDGRAESAGESLLRLFHVACDIPVRPQPNLVDDEGRFLVRADLLVVGTTFVHEYDGAVHRGSRRHATDLRRERRLAGSAYTRRGYTLDDLLNHALTVMHELDRALERPHRSARMRRWRALVADSLYSTSGRERVMNRWKRLNGFVEWSATA